MILSSCKEYIKIIRIERNIDDLHNLTTGLIESKDTTFKGTHSNQKQKYGNKRGKTCSGS